MDLTSATVVAHSVWDGTELVTFRATLPQVVDRHLIRHRAFSFSFASMRAIPTKKIIEQVEANPFIPIAWPKNKSGMSADGIFLKDADEAHSRWEWLQAKDSAIVHAKVMALYGVHKEIVNRLLAPFAYTTCIISTTMPGLENFFAQRDHPDAQPEIQVLARKMREALSTSVPVEAQWHIPFGKTVISTPEADWDAIREQKIIRAISKCARVSYGRELEERTFEEDKALVVRLARDKHWSPFEHVAFTGTNPALTDWDGDGAGWGIPYGEYYGQRHLGNFETPWAQARHHWRQLLPSIAAELDALS